MKKSDKRLEAHGFTLSEVLITLSIIGIIVAITIPVLITSYQKQTTVTKVQKVYSTLQQAIRRSEVDNGTLEDWDYNNNLSFMNTYIAPYLSLSKNCGTTPNGCWSGNFTYSKHDFSSIDNVSVYGRLALIDGTYVVVAAQGIHAHFIVDIDGDKGKSIYGKDVFEFTITPVGFVDVWHNITKPGLYFYGYGLPRSSLVGNCATAGGQHCGALIQYDSWKISDDYKW